MSVGPTRGPVMRPGEERDFTEIFQRVGDLERVAPGEGLQFNEGTYGPENVGDYLHIATTGAGYRWWHDSDEDGDQNWEWLWDGNSFTFYANSGPDATPTTFGYYLYGGDHYVYTEGGDWYVYTYDTDNPDDSGGQFYVYTSGNDINLNAQAQGAGSDGYMNLNAGSISVAAVDGVSLEARGSSGIVMSLYSGAGDAVTQFGAGSKVQFKDSSFASIFEVRDDGSVHIKTGSTIVADL